MPKDLQVMAAQSHLDELEAVFSADFVVAVTRRLRQLSDQELNALYLLTFDDGSHGNKVHSHTAVLLPLIEHESELRRHISVCPTIGRVCAPELYVKGGGHGPDFSKRRIA
ncbi:hypothetical protein [Pseudomonas monteilii]|uniref:hypothetical protein n=1 Tax=Pseudomonas monteilii TaxID=76759 RepID=UPI001377CC0A|nr:hypothetical protein [Pseudomonas monteilii]NBB07878.1 hypothetical protein [Pseudomonas monteilii]